MKRAGANWNAKLATRVAGELAFRARRQFISSGAALGELLIYCLGASYAMQASGRLAGGQLDWAGRKSTASAAGLALGLALGLGA